MRKIIRGFSAMGSTFEDEDDHPTVLLLGPEESGKIDPEIAKRRVLRVETAGQGWFEIDAEDLAKALAVRALAESEERLRKALKPFTLPHSTVDFSRWDSECECTINTPGAGRGQASHRITLADILEARKAIEQAEGRMRCT